MSFVLPVFHVVQACLSAYTGLLSYTSIVKLQKYEETSKKAAQYSSTAEHQLHKTRTTQTSGALATLCSLGSSITLVVWHSTASWPTLVIVSTVNVAATTFAHTHISNFWRNKAKVPFVEEFNDAITTSNQMRTLLAALAVTWAIDCFVYVFRLF